MLIFANGAERIRSAEEVLCSILVDENLGNFHCEADRYRYKIKKRNCICNA